MPKVNWQRVVAGGLAAGLIINLTEFCVNGILLRNRWERILLELNRRLLSSPGQVAVLQSWGFLIGISVIALYAHLIGPYRQGWRTACTAGLCIWLVGYISGAMTCVAMGVLPLALAADALLAGLIEIQAASLAGAALYRPRK
jgi:hypothetical protein